MVNRIFLVVFFVLGMHLPHMCSALDSLHSVPLVNLLDSLKFDKVTRVSKRDTTCGGQWAKVGTVCDKAKLLEHQQKEQRDLKDAMGHLRDVEDRVRKACQKLLKNKAIMSSNLFGSFKKRIVKIWADKNTKSKFDKSTEQCWSYFTGVRSSALCYVCSGNNYRYFLQDKALITQQECFKMASNCRNHFGHILISISVSKCWPFHRPYPRSAG